MLYLGCEESDRHGQGKLALSSYRWLTTLRHYMRSKTATNSEEFQSYVDRSRVK